MRYYAKVSFINYSEYGLLDTGANVSCIGRDLVNENFQNIQNFVECKSVVKTADSTGQKVVVWMNVKVTFKNKTKNLRLYIFPSISQWLIFGIDFWKTFDLLDNVLESTEILRTSPNSIINSQISDLDIPPEIKQTKHTDEIYIPLSSQERKKLDSVIELFPNFETHGLGGLISSPIRLMLATRRL